MSTPSFLYSHHQDGPAYLQPANPRVRRSLTVPKQAHPIVQMLLSTMKAQGIGYDLVAESSGILRATIKSWRNRSAPTYATIEAAFNAIGWSLIPCPMVEVLPEDIAADLARLAAKMRTDVPHVWSALAELAADQAFLRERAKERIEKCEAGRDARRIACNASIRRRRKPKPPANDNQRDQSAVA